MGADAFVVASQQDVFELDQPATIDGENDFVDDMASQEFRQILERMDWITAFQLNFSDVRRAGLVRQKSGEADSEAGGLLQLASQNASRVAEPHHHDKMARAEFAPHHAQKA